MKFDDKWTKECAPLRPIEWLLRERPSDDFSRPTTEEITSDPNKSKQQPDNNTDVITLEINEFFSKVEEILPESVTT
jgi:hypothetical protein